MELIAILHFTEARDTLQIMNIKYVSQLETTLLLIPLQNIKDAIEPKQHRH